MSLWHQHKKAAYISEAASLRERSVLLITEAISAARLMVFIVVTHSTCRETIELRCTQFGPVVETVIY
ncbi:hypothetical protein [Vibrio cholerae]|uniref:hypothetical protein n=1 Tax=Vibrio cholerae TaxID=666 RepID=UPI001112DF8E|nr:hypothetical protein [Vibrio cholerae]